jgi:hypothetical protein
VKRKHSDIHMNKRNVKALATCKVDKKEKKKEENKKSKLANKLIIIEPDYLS